MPDVGERLMKDKKLMNIKLFKSQICPKNTVKCALISHENEKEYDGVV